MTPAPLPPPGGVAVAWGTPVVAVPAACVALPDGAGVGVCVFAGPEVGVAVDVGVFVTVGVDVFVGVGVGVSSSEKSKLS
jgi:hypothetical protein